MKTTIRWSLLLISLSFMACKKESPATQVKTTQEKLLGKWNLVSEVTNDYYGGSSHLTTYNFQPGDYTEFKNDGKFTEYKSGTFDTYDYGIIDDSKIWMLLTNNIYELKILTASDLQLYKKEISGTDYYESTLTMKK